MPEVRDVGEAAQHQGHEHIEDPHTGERHGECQIVGRAVCFLDTLGELEGPRHRSSWRHVFKTSRTVPGEGYTLVKSVRPGRVGPAVVASPFIHRNPKYGIPP